MRGVSVCVCQLCLCVRSRAEEASLEKYQPSFSLPSLMCLIAVHLAVLLHTQLPPPPPWWWHPVLLLCPQYFIPLILLLLPPSSLLFFHASAVGV